jgi:hypothetical protein
MKKSSIFMQKWQTMDIGHVQHLYVNTQSIKINTFQRILDHHFFISSICKIVPFLHRIYPVDRTERFSIDCCLCFSLGQTGRPKGSLLTKCLLFRKNFQKALEAMQAALESESKVTF